MLASDYWSDNAAYYVLDINKEIMNEYFPNMSAISANLDRPMVRSSTDTFYFQDEYQEYIRCEDDWPLETYNNGTEDLSGFTIATWVAIKSRHG